MSVISRLSKPVTELDEEELLASCILQYNELIMSTLRIGQW